MDPVQNMPSADALATKDFNAKAWLQYYKNVWTRNLVARTIDVETDRILKAANPNEQVQLEDGSVGTVGIRLESRKIALADAKKLIASINGLTALSDADLEAKWSDEALKVDPDMIKKPEPEVGAACEIDGKPGKWMKGTDGKLVCMPISDDGTEKTGEVAPGTEKPAAPASPAAPAAPAV